jgi:serine/threonine-protein phosphatase 2A regulatory subunit A
MKGYYYPIAQYLDELASEDSKKRLNSVNHLMHISKALGPEKTKTQLIGFLKGKNEL